MTQLVVTVETLLLARYAEVLPDATLTVVGGGISALVRDAGTHVRLMLGATLLADGDAGEHSHQFRLRVRDPHGHQAAEATIDLSVKLESRARMPLALPIDIPADGPDGRWQVELSGADDLRVLQLDVQTRS